ncbi:MAG: PqqD family protein [Clostridia bacterium]|nr:PqqD family protein [Clostridia bacterium]
MKQPWATPEIHLTESPGGMKGRDLAALSDEELAALLQKPVCYRISGGFVTREIAGEVLAVPVGEMTRKLNGMITFSDSGALLWKWLEKPQTRRDLALHLATTYGKEIHEVESDVNEFVDKALARGMIQECD